MSNGYFNLARHLCKVHIGEREAVRVAMLDAGVPSQTINVALHQMQNEGLVRPTVVGMSEEQRYIRNARASVMHLIDLKRAQHRARDVEYNIPPDGDVGTVEYRTRRLVAVHSYCGSPGAMCAEATI